MAEYLYTDPSGRRYKIEAENAQQADLIVGEFFGQRQEEPIAPPVDPNAPDAFLGVQGEAGGVGTQRPVPEVVAGMVNYVRDHPDQVVEFLVQLGTTGVGMGAGAPLGPVGVGIGGAAGNVAGRGMAHDINRWLGFIPENTPAPEVLSQQGVIDAGVGALGGVVGGLAKPGARWLTAAPKLTPLDQTVIRETVLNNPMARERLSPTIRLMAQQQLQRTPFQFGGQSLGGASLAGVVAGAVTGHLPTALVAGAGVWGGRKLASQTLLSNQRFLEWALLNGHTITTPSQLAVGLLALAAEKNLEPDDRNFFAMAAAEFEHADPTIAREEFRALGGEPRFTGPSNRQEHMIRLGGRSGITPYVASRANGRFLRRASQSDIDTLMD